MTEREFWANFAFERDENGAPKVDLKPPPGAVASGGLPAFRRTCHLNGITTEETIGELWRKSQEAGG
jgi:hypothetical protein